MPRVSVIVPAYNSVATLPQTLASVQSQTFGDWEVVVGDDASTDGTAELVERLADSRISIVRATQNGGPAHARNLALASASGELVAFLDADDLWRPDYLERQVGRYDEESSRPGAPVGLVCCNASLVDEDGSPQEQTYLDLLGRYGRRPVTVDSLLRRNSVYISCLVPRQVGAEVGWFDPQLYGTEDYDLWLKILETGRRAVLDPEPLAVYRRSRSSVSSNTSRQGVNNQKALLAALERGRLTAAQRRIARSELRYNRALEVVAAAVFDGQPPAPRTLPGLAWVAVTRPRHWGEWLSAVRSR